MAPRYRLRPTDPLTRFRNMEEVDGLRGHAGRSRIGGVAQQAGGGAASVIIDGSADQDDPAASAQLLVLSATGGSIASGGDHLTFDTILAQQGFDGVVVQAGDTWTHPVDGVYLLTLVFEWDSYEGGGTVELEIAGVVEDDGTLATGSTGSTLTVALPYFAEADRVGKIKVTQTSGSAQTCDARMSLAITDPLSIDAGTWTKEYDADIWGITKIGSSWWTTGNDTGETVAERDADGTVLSSFEATAAGGTANRVRGITYDGTNLWVVGADEEVVEYNTSGTLQSQFTAEEDQGETHNGLAWDGTNLWLIHDNPDPTEVEEYDTSGTKQSEFTLPAGKSYKGMTVFGGDLWIVNATDDTIDRYTTSGTLVDSIDTSAAATGVQGVWISDTGVIYVAKPSDGLYKRSGRVSA